MPLEILIGPQAERFLMAAEQQLADRMATRIVELTQKSQAPWCREIHRTKRGF